MFDDIHDFNFTIPEPPEPDRFDTTASEIEFSEWVRQAADEFEREVEEARRSFFNELATITADWERELGEILDDERDNADFPFPVVSPKNLPEGYKMRQARYSSADDVAAFLNDAGLTPYSPVVVRLTSGLWTFALE